MSEVGVKVRRYRAGRADAARVAAAWLLAGLSPLIAGCSGGSGSSAAMAAAKASVGGAPVSTATSGAAPASTPAGTQPPTTATTRPKLTAAPTASPAKPAPTTVGAPPAAGKHPAPPPPGAKFDYQIGGAYPPPAGVRIVSRDSSATPATGVYNICYLNAFQTQPDATAWWQGNHPDLLLHDHSGALVIDQDWNEAILDVSTPAKRAALAQIEDGWIDGCARKGFQAVEADNLDSHSRSAGLLTPADDVEFAKLITAHAHSAGLAVAQKNATELLGQRAAIGFDFAVAEQCGSYGECGQYADAYADHVVDVEYDDAGFAAACHGYGSSLSIVRRDLDVSAAGGAKYVFRTC